MSPKPATGRRTERDPIGEKQIPASVLYGIQTLRARWRDEFDLDVFQGFMGAAELANKAIETGKSVDEIVAEEKCES